MDDLTVQLLRGVEMLVVLAIDGDTVGLEVRPHSICKVGSDGVLDASALQVFNRAAPTQNQALSLWKFDRMNWPIQQDLCFL